MGPVRARLAPTGRAAKNAAMPPSPERRAWRELLLLYGATLVVTAGLTLLQGSVAWVRGYTLVVVAAVFLYLPIEVLHRTGRDPADFGIHRRRPWRGAAFALLVMLATLPPYFVGFHVWQTQWLGREAAPAEVRLDRWPVELHDAPRATRLAPGEVRLFSADGRLWLRWHLPAGQRFEARIEGEGPLEPRTGPVERAGDALRVEAGSDGQVTFSAPGPSLALHLRAGGDRLPPERLKLGTGALPADANPYRAERGYWWLLNLILVQLLLVALPEEVFYRGYLQTRLDKLVGRDVRVLGVSVNLHSLVLTSALFAIGHFVTIPSAHRLAVFFPSLLFGWMRRATGGIVAPVLYHAACNLSVELVSLAYG